MNYKELARDYDLFIYDIDYDNIIKFYKNEIKKAKIDVRSILELGCGTGNITSRLYGYNVYAIDYSEEMLAIAKSKLYNRRNIQFFHKDIREIDFNKKFDLSISTLDVLNYLPSENDFEKVIELVYNHLEKDGLFIFDINSNYKIKNVIGNNIFTDEVGDSLYIWEGNYDDKTNINSYVLNFFKKDTDGKYNRYTEVHKEKGYETEYIVKVLEKNGFINIKTYDEFSTSPVKDESLRISFVAQKGDINDWLFN